ncbi:DUF3866 family protein [Thermoanaerobacterium butyriciformans]|uniref:DUF3866 family protein n=1 Tax=Thermoanaerobacterium butyriciformans TaxID=1702242 RepID=UPI001AEAAAC0|nr:DUF3866 family protein [Thermoanaerobacterium butyriciformans]
MIFINKGIVKNIISKRDDISFIEVDVDGVTTKAINYNEITGEINVDDVVYINQTARNLNLGTGGYDFVILNTKYDNLDFQKIGHIMKLRYTPMQINVLSVEEQDSPYHDIFNNFKDLGGMPVIVGELHSMLAPTAVVLKKLKPAIKISYIMSDSACLPISFSNTVRYLKENNIIDSTITMGHAFGGDFEAVNIYSSLISAKEIVKSDVAIVAMGPGIVGTGTKYGFSGIDQASIIDAINKLKGIPILIPRISFNDKRERHIGISHHTATVIELLNSSCNLTMPILDNEKHLILEKQLKENHAFDKVNKYFIDSKITSDILLEVKDLKFTTMGRTINEEKEFFDACGAAAIYCSKLLGIN